MQEDEIHVMIVIIRRAVTPDIYTGGRPSAMHRKEIVAGVASRRKVKLTDVRNSVRKPFG